jgi:hypothetical protein
MRLDLYVYVCEIYHPGERPDFFGQNTGFVPFLKEKYRTKKNSLKFDKILRFKKYFLLTFLQV